MLQRPIPATGELLPVLGLGTWIQFDVGSAGSDRQPLRQVLQMMAEQGSTVIDASPMYGRSEAVVGELTVQTGLADEFFYATKVWTTGRQAGIDQMETSLRLMQRQSMDLIQIHNLVDWQTHLKTLRQWKESGKIRYLGITHYRADAHEQLEHIIRAEPLDFVQFNYSIGIRQAEKRLLAAAQEHGVAVLINEPLEKGRLFQLVQGKPLPAWAAEWDIHNWAQFFLKYILGHPAVTCVLAGTSDPKHLADNLSAGVGRLPDEATRRKMVEVIDRY
jgi:diketogulonate reductase-like aldo/keto reductase